MEAQPEAPRPLRDRPVLLPDLVPIWDAFVFLGASRMENRAIPLAEIMSYFRDFMGEDNRDTIQRNVRYIRALDQEFCDLVRERNG